MKRTPSAERGFSLIVAMLVVVVLTLLVVGAIAFTGSERSASIQRTRAEGLSSCAEAARSMFLSHVRVLKGEVPTTIDGQLGPQMTIEGGHYSQADGGSVTVDNIQVVPANEVSGAQSTARDLSNWVGGNTKGQPGGNGLYATYYKVNAVCNEKAGGPQQEVEFVMRVGL